jgi:hypothetical protein
LARSLAFWFSDSTSTCLGSTLALRSWNVEITYILTVHKNNMS